MKSEIDQLARAIEELEFTIRTEGDSQDGRIRDLERHVEYLSR